MQHGQDLRGGAEAQRQADREAGRQRVSRRQPDQRRHRQTAQDHLRAAEPEDRRFQTPQPRRGQLQPDDEKQHHDADFGDCGHLLRIADEAENMRPDHRARDEVTQRRTKPETAEQQHEAEREAQHEHAVAEDERCAPVVHLNFPVWRRD